MHAAARPSVREEFSLQTSLLSLGLGAFLCWLDTLDALSRYVLRFLAALVHEMGHATVALCFGAPAFPVLSLDGHAATFHLDQHTWLAVGISLVLACLAWCHWQDKSHPKLAWGLGVAAVLHPLLAFTSAWKVLHLAAGHLAELAFAGLCFFRAWTGGFTHNLSERHAYAALGWYLALSNLVLHGRLLTDPGHRAQYQESGSFGLTQDYICLARDHLGWSLQGVALAMLLGNLVLLPVLTWRAVKAFTSP